jgi:hypothetical protein
MPARRCHRNVLCHLTGVPGAGKTRVGFGVAARHITKLGVSKRGRTCWPHLSGVAEHDLGRNALSDSRAKVCVIDARKGAVLEGQFTPVGTSARSL